jgi:DHA1 family bicyclomycin/chloramphenicol resistance-like MFS transporter
MSRHDLRLTLILGALSAFSPMSIDMYLPSLPALERDFATDTAAVQLTLSAFFLGLALGQALYGPLADRHGRRPPLLAGIALYVLASVGCALATSIEALVALRLLQAMGGCAGVVIARAVVRDLFDPQAAARMLSLLMLVMGVAPILAPLAGGVILVWAGWRWIFAALALFGLACLLAVAAGLRETRPAHTVRPGLASSLRIFAGLARDRRFLGPALTGGLAQAGMFAYISGSPFVFIQAYGVPAQHYGWLFGLNAAGIIGGSQLNRWLLRRHPAASILHVANGITAACGLVLLAVAWTGAGGLPLLLAPLFGYVASLGFTYANAAALAMAPFPEKAGSASALLGTVQFGAAAVAGSVVGHLHDGTAVPMAAVIAACGILALAARLTLMGRRPV